MKQFILLLSLVPFMAFAQIYKSIDSDGNTVYTDIPPNDDAKELEVEELNIADPPKKTYGRDNTYNSNDPRTPVERKAPEDRYRQLNITSPQNEESVRDNEGKVSISVALSPMLFDRFKDKLYIAVDGNVVSDGAENSVDLDGVDRGAHTITAYVQDKDGKIVISAQPVTFYMLRAIKRS